MLPFDETTKRLFREMQDNYDGEDIDLEDIFRDGRNSVKDSLEILARAASAIDSRASQGMLINGLAEAIAAVKERGDWPLPECEECETGFPLNKHGEHYGTQSLGMIPTTRCKSERNSQK